MTERIDYRSDIDGLRAIAVLAVIGFHAFPNFFPGGFVGVDIFFVISGYLITKIILSNLQAERFSIVEFYVLRIRRIFPALVLVLVFCLVAGWIVLSFDEYIRLGRHVAAAAAFILNFRLLKEAGYFDVASELKPLLHLWSLSVEEQFYLCWPLLLAIAWRFRKVKEVLVLIFVCSLLACILLSASNAAAAFFLPTTRFWELMTGGLLAAAEIQKFQFKDSTVPHVLSAAGLVLIASSFWLIDANRSFPGYWAILPVSGAALIIAAGMRGWLNHIFLSGRIFVAIGLISYPLYLWHWPLLSFERIREGHSLSINVTFFLVGLSFLFATATFVLIERPIRGLALRTFNPFVVTPLLLLMLASAAAGLRVPPSKLALSRFPRQVRHFLVYKFDQKKWRIRECFLQPKQDAAAFNADCIDKGGDEKPLVLLWGDSHAAQLVPGFHALRNEGSLRFGELTAASCPPILEISTRIPPHCHAINEFVLDKIASLKPRAVVIAGYWQIYATEKERWHFDPAEIAHTVQAAKNAGAENVLVIGQVPTWEIAQPKVIVEEFDARHFIPDKTTRRLDGGYKEIDRVLRPAVTAAGGEYLSPSDYLCDRTGCLLYTAGEPISFDTDHLTEQGSILLVKEMKRNLALGEPAKNR